MYVEIENETDDEAIINGLFSLRYTLEENGQEIRGNVLCGKVACDGGCTLWVPSGELQEKQSTTIQFYLPDEHPITTENFNNVQWTLIYQGQLGNETNSVIGKVFPDPDQKNKRWGEVLFNEEWEDSIYGYPENNWGHGRCWIDADRQGYQRIDETSGSLQLTFYRGANERLPGGCYSGAETDIEISPNTWFQFLIQTDLINPIREDDVDKQIMYMQLEFDNGINIYFTDDEIEFWPNSLPEDPNNIFIPLNSGQFNNLNLYSLFTAKGISITEPLTLTHISFYYKFETVETPPPANQYLYMFINSLRLIEADPQFSLCQ